MLFQFNLSGRNIYNYEQYRNMLSHLLAQGKTTGEDQSESMIEYAKLNNARMNRWDKTTKINYNEAKNFLQIT